MLCLRGYDTISFSLVFNSHFHAKYLASLTKHNARFCSMMRFYQKWLTSDATWTSRLFPRNIDEPLFRSRGINGRLSISNSKAVCRNNLHCANLLTRLYISLMFCNQAWDIVTAGELRKKLDFVMFDLLCSWSSHLNTSEHRNQSLGISRK